MARDFKTPLTVGGVPVALTDNDYVESDTVTSIEVVTADNVGSEPGVLYIVMPE